MYELWRLRTFFVWRLRTGACGVGAYGFWRYRMPPVRTKPQRMKNCLNLTAISQGKKKKKKDGIKRTPLYTCKISRIQFNLLIVMSSPEQTHKKISFLLFIKPHPLLASSIIESKRRSFVL